MSSSADASGPSVACAFPKLWKGSTNSLQRIKELEYRLWLLEMHERRRNGKVSGLDIEHVLRRVAKWCGAKEDFHGIASKVTYHLDQEARCALLGWLFDIEESMRWDPRRYWHALHQEEVERMVAQNRAEYEARSRENQKGSGLL